MTFQPFFIGCHPAAGGRRIRRKVEAAEIDIPTTGRIVVRIGLTDDHAEADSAARQQFEIAVGISKAAKDAGRYAR